MHYPSPTADAQRRDDALFLSGSTTQTPTNPQSRFCDWVPLGEDLKSVPALPTAPADTALSVARATPDRGFKFHTKSPTRRSRTGVQSNF